ncbi:hypothetical protein [Pseudoteredinibacter isoporae]|uniref:Uncharacterized protein n=1 Tax=Pseudoteredinibacter isoporae TaxID=570281 RepID=A0A7X0JU77_9GAMM|nr:hypothetical protein [Pseudoteredinibacter isoporae]MBB6521530.1 hypothetical protein [Pseudoteredinibacter isoporae]NHO87084.1 hypothetical protein [Pseudoteredinibacter isoporae]NIB22831.1 hypothetical protein [Pseudoteredinibacter isoporae]
MYIYHLHVNKEDSYSYEDQLFRNPVTIGEKLIIEGEHFVVDNVMHDMDSGESWLFLVPAN